MDSLVFDHLSDLSKLSFSDNEKAAFAEQMSGIIALMDKVREFPLTYDDTMDGTEIKFSDLRLDKAAVSFPAELLLSNTQPRGNAYVIPKMME